MSHNSLIIYIPPPPQLIFKSEIIKVKETVRKYCNRHCAPISTYYICIYI